LTLNSCFWSVMTAANGEIEPHRLNSCRDCDGFSVRPSVEMAPKSYQGATGAVGAVVGAPGSPVP
jgi:hypothetical protein